tara:strand:+ start:1234 stop:2490 length:1257 start_codon:yes stop_codon:yes gene_type:complete
MAKKKYTILFVHQNFPGQYKHLAPALAKMKNIEAYSISKEDKSLPNIKHYKYEIKKGNVPGVNNLTIEFETKMIRAKAVADLCLEMKKEGIIPDVILSHPGWGESFLLKEVWPDAKFLNYFEFYYNTKDSDIDFDLKETQRPDYDFDLMVKLRARNAPFLSAFEQSDIMISPTEFQKSTAPEIFKDRISVVHEGIDTNLVKPNEDANIRLKNDNNGKTEVITKDDKVITFVNRNLEPYRGYHIFMRSLPEIISKHPDAYILIVGGDQVSYGATPEEGSYKDIYYNEIKDKIPKNNKIRFCGVLDYNTFLNLIGVSSVHVYLTYPFVLSWSMLEAMSMEKLVIGSKTKPVEEIITDKKNGLLVDFFNHKKLSLMVNEVLSNPDKYLSIKKEARKTILDNYDLETICLPKQIEIFKKLLK